MVKLFRNPKAIAISALLSSFTFMLLVVVVTYSGTDQLTSVASRPPINSPTSTLSQADSVLSRDTPVIVPKDKNSFDRPKSEPSIDIEPITRFDESTNEPFVSTGSSTTDRALASGSSTTPSSTVKVAPQIRVLVTSSDGSGTSDVDVDLFTADSNLVDRLNIVDYVQTDSLGKAVFDEVDESGCYIVVFIAPPGKQFTNGEDGFKEVGSCIDEQMYLEFTANIEKV